MKRNYKILGRQIEKLRCSEVVVEKPLHIRYNDKLLPIYQITIRKHRSNPWILMVGGQHGEEPGAVYSLIESISNIKRWSYKYNFIIFPCINPYGYISGSRFTKYTRRKRYDKYNLNYNFYDGTKDKVTRLIMEKASKCEPIYTIDVHEDDASRYLALYEKVKKGVMPINLLELESAVDILPHETCHGDPVKDGVIYADYEEETLEYWSFINGSKISMTLELPGKLDLYSRIQIGKESIELILKKLAKKNL